MEYQCHIDWFTYSDDISHESGDNQDPWECIRLISRYIGHNRSNLYIGLVYIN